MNDQVGTTRKESTQNLIRKMNPPDGSDYHAGTPDGVLAAQELLLQDNNPENGVVLGFIATMRGGVYDKITLAAKLFHAVGIAEVLTVLEEETGSDLYPRAINSLLKQKHK